LSTYGLNKSQPFIKSATFVSSIHSYLKIT